MKDELIKFETAKLAKEKGFFVWCQLRYKHSGQGCKLEPSPFLKPSPDRGQVFAPTQALLQRWLREVHGVYIVVDYYGKGEHLIEVLNYRGNNILEETLKDAEFKTYEEALEAGLVEALKLIEL